MDYVMLQKSLIYFARWNLSISVPAAEILLQWVLYTTVWYLSQTLWIIPQQ